jgi:hypothetical protein
MRNKPSPSKCSNPNEYFPSLRTHQPFSPRSLEDRRPADIPVTTLCHGLEPPISLVSIPAEGTSGKKWLRGEKVMA